MDIADSLRLIASLAVVLGLIGLCALAARRFGLAPGLHQRGTARRLAVVEVAPLGGRHRLVLVRRDSTEHLLLLGGAHDLVIERRIAPSAGAASSEGDAR